MRFPGVLSVLLLALSLVGCGAEDGPAGPAADPTDGHVVWNHCRLPGVTKASGVTVLGEDLLICASGGERRIRVVARKNLRHDEAVRSRELRVDVNAEGRIGGRELLSRRGYLVKGMWEAAIDLQGIAVQPPNHLYVADAAFRIVYWGRVEQDIGAQLAHWKLDYGFEVPGGKREGAAKADYRDTGPGLSGMFGVAGAGRTEDLYVVERSRPGGPEVASQFRVLVLDRYGGLGGGGTNLGFFTIDVGEGALPQVEGLARDTANNRFLCVRGDGRGSVAHFLNPGSMRKGKLGKGTPGPDIEGAGRWSGITVATDGTIYLVSDGDPARLAWRTP